MAKMDKKSALDIFVRTLKEKYEDKIERIILFGSVARGKIKNIQM